MKEGGASMNRLVDAFKGVFTAAISSADELTQTATLAGGLVVDQPFTIRGGNCQGLSAIISLVFYPVCCYGLLQDRVLLAEKRCYDMREPGA
jgi:hypothetical protein